MIWSKTSSYPSRPGNQLEVFIDGEASFAAIFDALAGAFSSIYATFAYVDFDFRMRPELPTSLIDLLKARAAAGVDVRLLIWDPVTKIPGTIQDPGTAVISVLNQGQGTVQARWDRPSWGGLYLFGCHHQKTYVVDGKTAFVGGINSTQSYWDTHDHDPLDLRRVPFSIPRDEASAKVGQFPPLHDLFTKIQGPAVQDVEANFIERWNGATFLHKPNAVDLTPHAAADPAGSLDLQIIRTIAPHQYLDMPQGERSIRESYLSAIASAKRFVYFENQYYYDHDITDAMEEAIERGVKVIGLMARRPDQGQLQGYFETAREWVGNAALVLRRKFRRDHVELYCPVIARPDPANAGKFLFEDIYVHAKVLIVDDSFFTIGSANISTFSMNYHSEMNVAANDPVFARALRKQLWQEHFQTTAISEEALENAVAGFDLWRKAAAENIAAFKSKIRPTSRIFPWDFDFD